MTDGKKNPIEELADSFRDIVQTIEAKTPTTRNHYGDYMGIMSTISGYGTPEDTPVASKMTALALVKAGANRQGVSDALRIVNGEGL